MLISIGILLQTVLYQMLYVHYNQYRITIKKDCSLVSQTKKQSFEKTHRIHEEQKLLHVSESFTSFLFNIK